MLKKKFNSMKKIKNLSFATLGVVLVFAGWTQDQNLATNTVLLIFLGCVSTTPAKFYWLKVLSRVLVLPIVALVLFACLCESIVAFCSAVISAVDGRVEMLWVFYVMAGIFWWLSMLSGAWLQVAPFIKPKKEFAPL